MMISDQLKRLAVQGYKSLRDRIEVDFGRLTVLAGANGSGKSSFIQPLLLLKQTFEAPYDPGGLLLSGPNVSFASAREMLWKDAEKLVIRMETKSGHVGECTFRPDQKMVSLLTAECIWGKAERTVRLYPEMTEEEVLKAAQELQEQGWGTTVRLERRRVKLTQYRAFLAISFPWMPRDPWIRFAEITRALIHVPALRGNPQRTYRYGAPSGYFPGLFTDYVAGVIVQWQEEKTEKMENLWEDLRHLELTWKVETQRVSATDVEVRVGRLPRSRRGGARDMVNIADAGFGVSQVLPVVVALQAAQRGQMVYIEQPEIHLHPSAQVRLADLLVQAAKRGVQVVVETHSELILLGIQTSVARGELSPDAVKLHWFERDEEGVTHITTAELDEDGAFGNWPVDFSQVALETMRTYLDTVTFRRSPQR